MWLRASSAFSQLLDAIEELGCDTLLREERQLLELPVRPYEEHRVLVDLESRIRARDVVGHDQIAAFASELSLGRRDHIVTLGGEADDRPIALACTDLGEDVRVLDQLEGQAAAVRR